MNSLIMYCEDTRKPEDYSSKSIMHNPIRNSYNNTSKVMIVTHKILQQWYDFV